MRMFFLVFARAATANSGWHGKASSNLLIFYCWASKARVLTVFTTACQSSTLPLFAAATNSPSSMMDAAVALESCFRRNKRMLLNCQDTCDVAGHYQIVLSKSHGNLPEFRTH